MPLTETAAPPRFYIERPPDEADVERAIASLRRGEADAENVDRRLKLILSPVDDPDEAFTGCLSVSDIERAEDGTRVMRGILHQLGAVLVRIKYSLRPSTNGAYGMIGE